MENASKALLISAGVLFAIIILSIGVFLYREFADFSDEYVEVLDQTEIRKYNSNFEIYRGRVDITAQEIVTAVSIARQKGQGTKIKVEYAKKTGTETKILTDDFEDEQEFNNWANEFLTNHILNEESTEIKGKNIFECTSIDEDDYGIINYVEFRQIIQIM